MRKAVFSLAFLILSSTCQRSRPEDLFSFHLSVVGDSAFAFSTLRDEKASVFVFLAPDCPLSQNYTLTLNTLFSGYDSRNVGFFGIIAGELYDEKEIEDFVGKYKIAFPVLRDRDFLLTDFLGAQVTPEVFITNPKARVVYQGAIDNWAESLGQHRVEATEFYVKDALSDLLEGREVRRTSTQTVGCFIERKNLSEIRG